MSPKLAPQKVASMVKLFAIPICRHITTRAVDSLHLRTRNLQPLNENLSGAWRKKKNVLRRRSLNRSLGGGGVSNPWSMSLKPLPYPARSFKRKEAFRKPMPWPGSSWSWLKLSSFLLFCFCFFCYAASVRLPVKTLANQEESKHSQKKVW